MCATAIESYSKAREDTLQEVLSHILVGVRSQMILPSGLSKWSYDVAGL